MKRCNFCDVELKMKVGTITGKKDEPSHTHIDYYWCPKCGLMYKGETIEGFFMGD